MVPGGHSLHCVPASNVPGKQFVHRSGAELQSLHVVAAAAEPVPTGQAVHTVDASKSKSARPRAHSVHEDAKSGENLPVEHCSHEIGRAHV